MPNVAVTERRPALELLASVFAGRTVTVAATEPGQPAWTDGDTVYLDPAAPHAQRLIQLAVQTSLIAAGSLAPDVMAALVRKPRVARRYLALEGRRALRENTYLLPEGLSDLAAGADREPRSDSPASSLDIASLKIELPNLSTDFGVLRPREIIMAGRRAATGPDRDSAGHVPRRPGRKQIEELDDGELDEATGPDLFTSPVGGGGFAGNWLKKLLSSARRSDDRGGGSPGADAPTHRTNSANRGTRAVLSRAMSGETDHVADLRSGKFTYPEWDAARKRYRPDWCTVTEIVPTTTSAMGAIDDVPSVARPLARLGLGLHRRHRQAQGDDIDIDAAVEERLEVRAGSVPDEAVYIDSLRRRRDLSVLLLLDVSGSAAEPGSLGRTVHEQQRTVAASLMIALHDLGDRVALFAYNSQGRTAVNMMHLKRFGEPLGTLALSRLNSLEPGGYSRLGAAIRHGAAVLEADGGTPRRLLVVLSDGLAYDHGYERDYGAADARRALSEARRRGTGCVCLTVGASTEIDALRMVFGSAAHATVARPAQMSAVIGPLFRSAIRSASETTRVRRPVS